MKFNKYYNILNYFVLQNIELYYQVFKVGQPKILVAYDYNIIEIIEKIYIQLKYIQNLNFFIKII